MGAMVVRSGGFTGVTFFSKLILSQKIEKCGYDELNQECFGHCVSLLFSSSFPVSRDLKYPRKKRSHPSDVSKGIVLMAMAHTVGIPGIGISVNGKMENGMGREHSFGWMAENISVNGKMVSATEVERLSGRTGINMPVNGEMGCAAGKAPFFGKMAGNISVPGKMICRMVMEPICRLTAKSMSASTEKANVTARARSPFRMVRYTLAIGRKGTCTERAPIFGPMVTDMSANLRTGL